MAFDIAKLASPWLAAVTETTVPDKDVAAPSSVPPMIASPSRVLSAMTSASPVARSEQAITTQAATAKTAINGANGSAEIMHVRLCRRQRSSPQHSCDPDQQARTDGPHDQLWQPSARRVDPDPLQHRVEQHRPHDPKDDVQEQAGICLHHI
jgi:hypothetical protein